MIAIHHKAKQFLLVLVKFLIVGLAFFYIFNRLKDDRNLDFSVVFDYLTPFSVVLLLLFSVANWFFEVLKWQNLVSTFKQIRFFEAAQQTFGSLTASVFTPNRIGEYGAKMLFFKKKNAKRIVFLNFLHNSSQMLITVVFGFLGLFFANFKFQISNFKLFGGGIVAVLLFFVLFWVKNIEIYGFSIKKLIDKIVKIDRKILFKTLGFSLLRYLVFSTQFLFLLLIFDIEIEVKVAFATIFMMYFLASVLPSIHFLDVVIKGSVAVFLFSKLGVEDWKILAVTSLMWLFNLVLPAVFGSYFVLRFNPKTIK